MKKPIIFSILFVTFLSFPSLAQLKAPEVKVLSTSDNNVISESDLDMGANRLLFRVTESGSSNPNTFDKNRIYQESGVPDYDEWRFHSPHNNIVLRADKGYVKINNREGTCLATDLTRTHIAIGNITDNTPSAYYELSVYGSAGKNDGSSSWNTFSDARLKTNIRDFTLGLDAVMKIQPKKFFYNGKMRMQTQKECIGIVAQDLQPTLPFMFDTIQNEEGEEYWNYDPSALDYIMVNAIKEQQKIIEELKKEIEYLKSKE